jgi:hypothetical protein
VTVKTMVTTKTENCTAGVSNVPEVETNLLIKPATAKRAVTRVNPYLRRSVRRPSSVSIIPRQAFHS